MLNTVILMGRLTADPELRTTQSGVSVASFTLAVERDYRAQGSDRRETDFIDIVAWRNTADFVCRYFQKGQMAAVHGRLQVRSYQDKDGNNRRAWEIVADNIYFADSKSSRGEGGNTTSSYRYDTPSYDAPARTEQAASLSNGSAGDFEPVADDDLPF